MTQQIEKTVSTPTPTPEHAKPVRGSKVDQWICLYAYPGSMLVVLIALFFVAPFLPPMFAGHSAARVAEMYRSHHTVLAWGVIVTLLAVGAQLPFQGLVVSYMRRMPHGGRLLGDVYLVSYAAEMLPSAFFWLLALGVGAYRPDRAPQLLMATNDLAYLGFLAIMGGFFFQYGSLALAIFRDGGKVLPLWLGYVSVWAAVSEVLLTPAFVFKAGPFSWNGLLVWWVAIVIFGIWIIAMTAGVHLAIAHDRGETATGADPEAETEGALVGSSLAH